MKLHEIMSKLFSFDVTTYYNWKKEKRLIIIFLEKYFTKEELNGIVQNNGLCEKLEIIKDISIEDLKVKLNFTNETVRFIGDITDKLDSFSRSSLIYLLTILNTQNKIIDNNGLFKFLQAKIEPKKFIDSMIESFKDFKIDFTNDNIIRKGFAKKLDDDLRNTLTLKEIDFIFDNKLVFIEKVSKIIEEKRLFI